MYGCQYVYYNLFIIYLKPNKKFEEEEEGFQNF